MVVSDEGVTALIAAVMHAHDDTWQFSCITPAAKIENKVMCMHKANSRPQTYWSPRLHSAIILADSQDSNEQHLGSAIHLQDAHMLC